MDKSKKFKKMKNKNRILKVAASAALAVSAIVPSFAQTNLGSACGCPATGSRTEVLMSTLADASGGANDGSLLANTTLTCDKTYILDKKIYVPDGITITIEPGTLIKGNSVANPADATALIVTMGGKINAYGTESCPIVFTAAADPMDGSYGIANRGKWGGVMLLGKAANNLTAAANVGTGKLGISDGVGYPEGFIAANSRNHFGGGTTPDNADNSGVLKYVSIRHAGAIIAVGNELNSLTLASVGSGTTVENVEVVSGDDDGIEIFGGTVNLKRCAVMYHADDMYDWDLGWTGKGQYLFGIKTDTTTSNSADNGIEADSDDNKSNTSFRSNPKIWNMTLIGNGNPNYVGDNTGQSAIMAKENTDGEIYNSIFANWNKGLTMYKLPESGRTNEAYENWNAGTFKFKNNTMINCTKPIAMDKYAALAASSSDSTKFFTTDGNTSVASVPGFDFTWSANTSTNVVSDKFVAVPTSNISSTLSPSFSDSFFESTSYRGAFDSNKTNWMSAWSINRNLGVTNLIACPTDLNNDGVTNNTDFLQLLGKFGQSCN